MTKSNTEGRELSAQELDQVSGGLNPQPLPPAPPPPPGESLRRFLIKG
jgi:hypothetical protein